MQANPKCDNCGSTFALLKLTDVKGVTFVKRWQCPKCPNRKPYVE